MSIESVPMRKRAYADGTALQCKDLERSTEIFGRLANPNGTNNALSQVLYGLALR